MILITILILCGVYAQKNQRPINKKFTSVVVEDLIIQISGKIKDANFRQTFINTFPNTLDTTVESFKVDSEGNPDSFIITGDIDAMWLRDSTNQLWTYIDYVSKDIKLQQLTKGLINRQIQQVLMDPYANAFNMDPKTSDWAADNTTRCVLGVNLQAMTKNLHERKYETDSLVAVLRLVVGYHEQTHDTSVLNFKYLKALQKIYNTFTDMQTDHEEQSTQSTYYYTFQRRTSQKSDTVINGIGEPVKRIGLLRTFFRASDDSTIYQFNIPENAMASAVLNQTSQMMNDGTAPWIIRFAAKKLKWQVYQLGETIKQAIYKHGVKDGAFLYEVDGFGNQVFMDDSNQPSLLSLPIYGFVSTTDPIYLKTRSRVLSKENPWYFVGTAAKGIGGPHVGLNYIWPMAIVTQAMTSNDKDEIQECIRMLVTTTGGTQMMHESFHKDQASRFTRSWFAWANGLFGELVLKVEREHPELLELIYEE